MRTEAGRRIRAAFVAAPGCRLISADYSQIELRVLAHCAEDPALIEAFARDEDMHARTAREVFGQLAPAEGRRLAKVMNYGIVYGMGAGRAAREMGVSLAQAEDYIAGYFARYPGVRQYIERTIATARERGFVTTVLGRRRYFPELGARDPAVRQFAERAAVNTPIQGSAADLIKLAMLEVSRRLARGWPGGAAAAAGPRRAGAGGSGGGGGTASWTWSGPPWRASGPSGFRSGSTCTRARIGRRSTGDERRALNTIGP